MNSIKVCGILIVGILCGCGGGEGREPSSAEHEAALNMARRHVWITMSDDAARRDMFQLVESGAETPADFKISGVSMSEYESRVRVRKEGGIRVAKVEYRIPSRVQAWPSGEDEAPPYPDYVEVPIQIDPKTGQAVGFYGPR
ncbi:MAG: hypothetical protein KBA51_00650 [Kiritimatiellae bacterium]|nr:hypothetical protein [Kiritimatiellia bacterium]